jgi:hypothetical protein
VLCDLIEQCTAHAAELVTFTSIAGMTALEIGAQHLLVSAQPDLGKGVLPTLQVGTGCRVYCRACSVAGTHIVCSCAGHTLGLRTAQLDWRFLCCMLLPQQSLHRTPIVCPFPGVCQPTCQAPRLCSAASCGAGDQAGPSLPSSCKAIAFECNKRHAAAGYGHLADAVGFSRL